MMRIFRRALCAILAMAGLATVISAQAVQLNPLGSGQVLLYPYYTVQRHPDATGTDYQTLFSITNEAFVPQAVRVRFVESRNSRTVFEFNLYLWVGDVWTGAVFAIPDQHGGGTGILTRDSSCIAPAFTETVPGFVANFARFRASDYQDDGGPTDLARTREGQIEVFAMADLAGSLYEASRPGLGADCSLLGSLTQATAEMSKPTGKLRGAAALIDVSQGLLFSYGAEALSGFTARSLFAAASAAGPALDDVNDAGYPTTVTANVFTEDGMLQASYPQERAIDAVSAALITDRIQNEFSISRALAAQSEWVFAFPTRRYYVDPRYTVTPIPPFDDEWDKRNGVILNATIWDRNSTAYYIPESNSGALYIDTVRALRRDTNVLTFIKPAFNVVPPSLLGATTGTTIGAVYSDEGWATMGFGLNGPHNFYVPTLRPPVAPHAGMILHGLPVIGFGVNAIVNGNVANGVLANYGSLLRHTRTVRCTEGTTACATVGAQ